MRKKQRKVIQDKGIIYNNVIYTIKEEENTASVIGSIPKIYEIFIPCSIMHNAKEYIVTSISENAFKLSNIQSVQFPSDSKLQIIEKQAFYSSSIKSIKIPSTVEIIGEGSFTCAENFKKLKYQKILNLKP